MQIINLLFILYSKNQKQEKGMERTVKYWKRKMQEYNERSDKGVVTDSQDEFDHGVHPMDPNVMGYWKK